MKLFVKYRVGKQTLPSDFIAKLKAPRMFSVPKLMCYLILLGLRIEKWGETFLQVNFYLICSSLKEAGYTFDCLLLGKNNGLKVK